MFKMAGMAMMHEAFVNDVLKQQKHVIPIAVQIGDDDRFAMQAKLPPRYDFHCFIQYRRLKQQ